MGVTDCYQTHTSSSPLHYRQLKRSERRIEIAILPPINPQKSNNVWPNPHRRRVSGSSLCLKRGWTPRRKRRWKLGNQPRESANQQPTRERPLRSETPIQRHLATRKKIKNAEKAIQALKRHIDKGTCPMSLKYKARANITADKDFKADVKRIRKYSESEYVKDLMRFHYRDIGSFQNKTSPVR